MKFIVIILLVFPCYITTAQTLGGSTVYNFLDLPNGPQLTALGGINVSAITDDPNLSFNDPALLRASMHSDLSTSFNIFYDGVHIYNLVMPFYSQRLQTSFSVGVNYFDYGTLPQTDVSGNILGDFHPADLVAQVSASRQYEKRWFYGATVKFIHSTYGMYRSSGAAMDLGVSYYDSAHLLQIGFSANNMGVQYRPYAGTSAGELPLDLTLGVTKRLAKAPLQFSFTMHHLQTFNIRYDDTVFNSYNGYDQNNKTSHFTVDKLFRHFIVAAQAFPEDRVEITVAYNYLRRKELDMGEAGNGFTGFSFGLGVLLKKWQLRYARSYYQNTSGYNQLGLNLRLND